MLQPPLVKQWADNVCHMLNYKKWNMWRLRRVSQCIFYNICLKMLRLKMSLFRGTTLLSVSLSFSGGFEGNISGTSSATRAAPAQRRGSGGWENASGPTSLPWTWKDSGATSSPGTGPTHTYHQTGTNDLWLQRQEEGTEGHFKVSFSATLLELNSGYKDQGCHQVFSDRKVS